MANNFKYMTEEDFYFIIEVLKDNLEAYKNNNIENNNYRIKLANGKEIYFNFRKATVAHLLGINTDYLMSLGYFKEKSSYELLENIIYNPGVIYEYSKNGILNLSTLFSDNIFEKNMIFKDLFKLDLDNLYFYSPTFTNKEDPNNINYDYGRGLLAYKIPDTNDEYRIVNLSKRTHGKYRAISSHRYYDNKEAFISDIKYFTKGQNITFITEASCYENEDEIIYNIVKSNTELLDNTKRIDSLNLSNKVHVLNELKSKYSIKCMMLRGIDEVFNATEEYDMLKRLYEVFVKNEETFTDDSLITSIGTKEDNKL